MMMCAGVSLTALAEAAQLGAVGGQAGSPLLSEAAKAAGVPCSPAQLYFLALEQVRACTGHHVVTDPPQSSAFSAEMTAAKLLGLFIVPF